MNTHSVKELFNASDIDNNNFSEQEMADELCGPVFTTIGPRAGRIYTEDEYEFRIENIDIESNQHKISINWFQTAGEVINHRTENSEGDTNPYVNEVSHSIYTEIIKIMESSRIK